MEVQAGKRNGQNLWNHDFATQGIYGWTERPEHLLLWKPRCLKVQDTACVQNR